MKIIFCVFVALLMSISDADHNTDPLYRTPASPIVAVARDGAEDSARLPQRHETSPIALAQNGQRATNLQSEPDSPPTNSENCKPGAYLEPREFTQPEYLGRPRGERAQMCFYRMSGSRAEYLNFYSTGHFYHTSISGSGGFASTGAVLGTVRGTYAFQNGNTLVTRVGYQGTGVTQTNRAAGTQGEFDMTAKGKLDIEMTLPNCQTITYRDEVKRVKYDRGPSHPKFIVVDNVRWERFGIDCPDWRGWNKD